MKRRVLIVDDSVFMLEEMRRMLEDTDYETAGYAKSGEEAIDEYNTLKPDAVTMDIILPEMDGLEAASRIRESWPEARVLMVSSLAYEETIEEAQKTGAMGFIFKPVEKEALIKALDKLFEEGEEPTEKEDTAAESEAPEAPVEAAQ